MFVVRYLQTNLNNRAYLFIVFVARQNKRKYELRLHFTETKGKLIEEYPNAKEAKKVAL